MSYTKISHYMLGAFIGALGLFNSSKLEIRQELNTNGELLKRANHFCGPHLCMYRRDYRGVLVHERNEKMPP